MPVLRCKMCGGTMEIDAKQSVAVCQYCGTWQTLPRLDSERIAGLYERAELLRRGNDFDKAADVYEQIVSLAPNDAEAYWSLVLCRYGIEYVEDPASHRRVPTINRVQFGSILEDADYLSALQNADDEQKSVYIEEAKTIEAIQKKYLAISEREKPFDIFICYKETDDNGRRTMDSVLANDLYHQLTQEGVKVFFSRITLEDKLGTEYEPYIFAAINSAKIMVVLGTRPEYFTAVWVRNEWSRFLSLIKSGAQKVLIPAYRDMSPYDLPEEFSHLQALDMSRLGFMQDLIRGIKKILGTESIAGAASAAVSPLLRRAFLFLEDRDWKNAAEYSEKILDQEPENAQAYLCKLMAEFQISERKELAKHRAALRKNSTYRRAVQYADAQLKAELESYAEQTQSSSQAETGKISGRKLLFAAAAAIAIAALAATLIAGSVKKNRSYESAKALLSAGEYQQAADAFSTLGGYKDSAEYIAEAEAALTEQENAAAYTAAQRLLEYGKFDEAIAAFAALGDYSDASTQIKVAQQKKQDAAKEEENRSAYEAAEKLLAAEDYDAAIEAFSALGNYADAPKRAAEAEEAKKNAEEEAANKEAYDAAAKLSDEKKYADAKAAFEALGDYSDAKEKAEKCQTQLDAQPETSVISSSPAVNTTTTIDANTKRVDKGSYYLIYIYNSDGPLAEEQQFDNETNKCYAGTIYEYNSVGQLISEKHWDAWGWYTNYYENGVETYTEFLNGKNGGHVHRGYYIYPDGHRELICSPYERQ